MQVVIVRTGTANLASVKAAFTRLGTEITVTEDPTQIATAPYIVLPGVGAFGAAIKRIDALGLRTPLIERIEAGKPTLAICLGMQILCEASEESEGVSGLGIVKERIERIAAGVRIPQLGWNQIHAEEGCALLSDGAVSFANSYCLKQKPAGWKAALCHYGETFVAAIEREQVLACQFHPELSGHFGLELLSRWLKKGEG